MKTVQLPSGAELSITLSPFAVSKALYQAILEEAKLVGIDPKQDEVMLYKDLLCSMLSSKKVEAALAKCMERCTYNGERIANVEATFELESARDDYLTVCFEVAKENISPFLKSLYVRYSQVLEKLKKHLK